MAYSHTSNRWQAAPPTARRTVAWLLLCLLAAGCTTHSYYRADGTHVTVRKFAGIPYLEEEERTTTRPVGSGYEPVE